MDNDIGEITYGLREGARKAFNRRAELGDAELKDIVEAAALLTSTLQQIDRQREAARAA